MIRGRGDPWWRSICKGLAGDIKSVRDWPFSERLWLVMNSTVGQLVSVSCCTRGGFPSKAAGSRLQYPRASAHTSPEPWQGGTARGAHPGPAMNPRSLVRSSGDATSEIFGGAVRFASRFSLSAISLSFMATSIPGRSPSRCEVAI